MFGEILANTCTSLQNKQAAQQKNIYISHRLRVSAEQFFKQYLESFFFFILTLSSNVVIRPVVALKNRGGGGRGGQWTFFMQVNNKSSCGDNVQLGGQCV